MTRPADDGDRHWIEIKDPRTLTWHEMPGSRGGHRRAMALMRQVRVWLGLLAAGMAWSEATATVSDMPFRHLPWERILRNVVRDWERSARRVA
jgi:hypothetical protein